MNTQKISDNTRLSNSKGSQTKSLRPTLRWTLQPLKINRIIMRKTLAFSISLALILVFSCTNDPGVEAEKYRVVIMTDMTHDDGNSLIRYLHYSEMFDTEAIIVTPQLPDFNFDSEGPWNKAQGILSAYQTQLPQLRKHEPGLASCEEILSVTKKGRGALPIIWLTNEKSFRDFIAGRYVESGWGEIRFEDWIGEGLNPNGESKDSEGSEFLQGVFEKEDDRPIYVQMWGGPITFIQALYRYKQRKGEEEFNRLLSKLHVYGILLQDITFDFMIDIDEVKAMDCGIFNSTVSTYEGERNSPRWLLHDGGHFWDYCCPGNDSLRPITFHEVNGHGPLSDIYDGGGEGDTPAFLYLVSARYGLNDPMDPTQGSWGGRFQPMGDPFPDGYYHTCGLSKEELRRWFDPATRDFKTRLDWNLKEPGGVNCRPNARLEGYPGIQPIVIKVEAGQKVRLDASPSFDPDQDELIFEWFWYSESGEYGGLNAGRPLLVIQVPEDIRNNEIHMILRVKDKTEMPLESYRRVILKGNQEQIGPENYIRKKRVFSP